MFSVVALRRVALIFDVADNRGQIGGRKRLDGRSGPVYRTAC
jgi:hypothetical protein